MVGVQYCAMPAFVGMDRSLINMDRRRGSVYLNRFTQCVLQIVIFIIRDHQSRKYAAYQCFLDLNKRQSNSSRYEELRG